MPNRWEHDIQSVSMSEIRMYCVQDEEWQTFRHSMKGKPTLQKLDMLELWRQEHTIDGVLTRRAQVQIDNYVNALKRGGQLSLNGMIQK